MASQEEKEDTTPRWASLADRLNPTRTAFDPKFKAEWKTLDKATKKKIIAEDKRNIQKLQQRAKPLPFPTDANDHCETSKTAYGHIVPFLKLLARKLKKPHAELRIFDPYYCAGSMVQHLKELGFSKVHNQPDDFYQTIRDGVPIHDVLVTNPPYSGDHFDRLKKFLSTNKAPHFLLLPDHFQVDDETPDYVVLKPKERYHYWTPRGLRPEEDSKKRKHRNLMLGSRNSPFPSKWCISLDPVVSKKDLLEIIENEVGEECTLHEKDSNGFSKEGAKFKHKNEASEDETTRKKKK